MHHLAPLHHLLKQQSTLTLATTADDGAPCAAALFYIPDDSFALYWFSSETSEHSRNLARLPNTAVTICYATDQWQEIRGVQMRGVSQAVRDQILREKITLAYVERFHLGDTFAAAITRSTLYVFHPAWIRYSDNSQSFGYNFEFKPSERERTESFL